MKNCIPPPDFQNPKRAKFDNVLPKPIELPNVLHIAVHVDHLTTWMCKGGHTKTCSFQNFFPRALLYQWVGWGGWPI